MFPSTVLAEPLAGLQTQALGLAEAAGLRPAVHALHPRLPWRWMAARTWPAPLRAVRLPPLGDGAVIGAGGVCARPCTRRRDRWRTCRCRWPRFTTR